MCVFGKLPQPKASPALPNPRDAVKANVSEQRRALAESQGRRSTILTRLRDEDVAASGMQKKLGGGQ